MRCAGDYKCDGCPDAQALPNEKGFKCRPMEAVSLDARNRLSSRDPAMQARALCCAAHALLQLFYALLQLFLGLCPACAGLCSLQ
jgi:hypothetical protein